MIEARDELHRMLNEVNLFKKLFLVPDMRLDCLIVLSAILVKIDMCLFGTLDVCVCLKVQK